MKLLELRECGDVDGQNRRRVVTEKPAWTPPRAARARASETALQKSSRILNF